MYYKARQQDIDWSKRTVQYALSNEKRIMSIIRNVCRKSKHIISSDTWRDIYQESLIRLATTSDYSIEIANQRGIDITLEAYTNAQVKNCAKAYIDKLYRESAECLSADSKRETESGDTISLLDSISDIRSELDYDASLADLRLQLALWESRRYICSIDLFLLLYIGTQEFNAQQRKLARSAFGITERVVAGVYNEIRNHSDYMSLLRDIVAMGGRAGDIIGERVYCKAIVDKVLMYIKYNIY